MTLAASIRDGHRRSAVDDVGGVDCRVAVEPAVDHVGDLRAFWMKTLSRPTRAEELVTSKPR